MKRVGTATFVTLICAFVLACSGRPAAIGEDANYILEVTNPMPHQMVVSADLGASQLSVLGTVEAGQTVRFEIRNPSTNDILVRAAPTDNSHPPLEKRVELDRDEVARVTLRN